MSYGNDDGVGDGWRDVVRNRKPETSLSSDLEKSAVVVPVYEDSTGDGNESGGEERECLLFTRRSDDLPRHAGQVSFPGGREEEGDGGLLDTGLRELHEEVGVARDEVDVIGRLDDVRTTTGYLIRPFVAEIPYPYPFEVQESEVDTLIFAPVDDLTEPSIHETRTRGEHEVHYFHYDDYTIWGATARILVQLLGIARSWSPR
ncbi:MAG: CoA pyrophosphatase [Halobacteria archaeon]|nr:CoA pyrophosphatase [Halobacteria archaeon]